MRRPWTTTTTKTTRTGTRRQPGAAGCGFEPLETRALLSASINVADITTARPSHNVVVTYTDPQGVDAGTIDSGDVNVGGAKPVTATLTGTSGSGTQVTATYSLTGPDGTWDSSDNGTYTVSVSAAAVKDAAGNDMDAGDTASFGVNVAPPPDNVGPTTSISVADVTTAGGATHTVTVTYTDTSGISESSIGEDDITITPSGGGGPLNVTNATVAGGTGTSRTALYTFAAPGGTFDAADNGSYTITVNAGAVQDASANGNADDAATFNVNVAGPADNTPPTSSISVGDVTGAGSGTHTVAVTYTDDTAIDVSTIGTGDLQVTRAGGGAAPNVTNVTTNVSGDGRTVVASYTLAPPGGNFDAADNGSYTVSLGANEVRDAAGNAAATATASFGVNISPGGGNGDTAPPTASVSAGDVTSAGGATHAITVTYADNAGIDVSTIDTGDLTVTGPGGAALGVTGFSNAVGQDGRSVTTTYAVAAPGGSFDAADAGAYAVAVAADAVRDTAGNGVAAASSNFNVSLTGGPGDGGGPSASVSAGNVTTPGAATHEVTVVYTDEGRVRANTIGVDDITVSRGDLALQVTNVATTVADSGAQITAVYTVAAPGGAWDTADNGAYTVTVAAGAVTDTQGNPSAAATGAFTVDATVVDNAPPAVAAVAAPDVTSEGFTTQAVTVTYTDDVAIDLNTIGTDDVTVTGSEGALVAGIANVAVGTDSKSVTVAYTFAAPGGLAFTTAQNGAYTIAIAADAVRDTAGKPIPAAAGAFQVNIPAPPTIDPGFGNGQPVVTNYGAEAAAPGAGGKLIVTGRSGGSTDTTGGGAVLEVRNPDGSLDTKFNRTGQVVSTLDDAYNAVLMQGDKILVAGTAAGDFVLARYLPNGRLDPTFGTGGRMAVDFNAQADAAYALALDADGRIIVAGQSAEDFAVARLSPDGALDAGFGGGGRRTIDPGAGAVDLAGAVVVQADGRVLLAGASGTSVAVVRLTAAGQDDASFSGDGVLLVGGLAARNGNPETADRAIGLALQTDGKILVANHTPGDNFGVARVDAAGNLDASFGSAGIASPDFGGADDADAIVVQPTGEILVLGTSLVGGAGSATVAAFDESGDLIEAFGTGGKLALDPGVSGSATRELRAGDLLLRAFGTRLPDGRLVLGANTTTAQNSQSALRRINVPGVQSQPAGVQIGQFGAVGNAFQKLVYTDGDGTRITFNMKGGTGTAFLGADNRINLVLTDAGGGGVTVRAGGKGGDGRIALGDVTVTGSIASMTMKNGDLAGNLCATGTVGKLALGNVSGGSLCSAGSIASLSASSLTNARVLAGANLGADGEFGGTGAGADTYSAASIGTVKVAGQITGSTVAAGLDPVDNTFGDGDDRLAGTAATSFVRTLTARGADNASRFLAGQFGKAKLGAKVNPAADPRFRILQ